MTSEQIAKIAELMRRKTAEIAATPEIARDWLYKLGTHNRDGSLTAQYGGDYTDPDHPAHAEP